MEIDGIEYEKQLDKELEAKIDMFIELTERLLSWLQEEGIDYSHILREYEKDHNGETVKTAFSWNFLFLWYNIGRWGNCKLAIEVEIIQFILNVFLVDC